MTYKLLLWLPNFFTMLRFILTPPICMLIISGQYVPALWIALIAGISDALDGWTARRLNVISRFGAIADPLADKFMLGGVYLSFSIAGLLPWWVTLVVLGRDVFIVAGALAFHWRFGHYEMDPSAWGKFSTFLQILFAVMLLAQQVQPLISEPLFLLARYALVLVAFISAGHYLFVWGSKARAQVGS
jgi:cardiolipin synthase